MSHIFLNKGLVIEFCDSQPLRREIIKRENKDNIIDLAVTHKLLEMGYQACHKPIKLMKNSATPRNR